MKDVSVVITSYNAEATIGRALASVADRRFAARIEAIVVDDCSGDRTVGIIEEFCRRFDNIRLVRMPSNTGSPSRPRNEGMALAAGEYVTFLDDDDYMDAERLLRMVGYAREHNIEFLKGYLKIVKAGAVTPACMIADPAQDQKALMEQIVAQQSTTSDVILSRAFLQKSGVQFDADIRVGEDTVFHTALLAERPVVGYVDEFFLYYCHQANAANLSSTQEYSDRALSNHLHVWQEAEENLNKIGLSYYKLRLPAAVRLSLMSIVSHSRGKITEPCFQRFSEFIHENQKQLKGALHLHPRYKQVYAALLLGDYESFRQAALRRLLVAGELTDGAKELFSALADDYDIEWDVWPEGAKEPERKELLDWADFLWCEGLSSCTAWYSRHKLRHQTLIVRAQGREAEVEGIDAAAIDCLAAPGYDAALRLGPALGVPNEKVAMLLPWASRAAGAGPEPGRRAVVLALGEEYESRRELVSRFSVMMANISGSVDEMAVSLHTAHSWEEFLLAPAEAADRGQICFILAAQGVEYEYPIGLVFPTMEAMGPELARAAESAPAYEAALEALKEATLRFTVEAAGPAARQLLEQARLASA